jgi:hypothetical protein
MNVIAISGIILPRLMLTDIGEFLPVQGFGARATVDVK